jgi:hypothetical protein
MSSAEQPYVAPSNCIDLTRVREAVECYRDGIFRLTHVLRLCAAAGLSPRAARRLLLERWCRSESANSQSNRFLGSQTKARPSGNGRAEVCGGSKNQARELWLLSDW